MPCSANRQIITELQKQAKEMEDELYQWKEVVKCRRDDFYELNYFNTMQLLALRRELGKLNRGSHIVSPDVLALLQSISSQVSPQIVSDAVCQITNEVFMRLPEIASESHEDAEMEDLPTHTGMEMSSISQLLSNEDKPTEPPKANLNELVPNLTEDDLSETQKEMMANISTRLNCSKQLILTAFEECPGDENDRYDFENWCFKNLDRDIVDEGSEEENECDSDSEASSDSDDSVAENQHFKYSSSMLMYIL